MKLNLDQMIEDGCDAWDADCDTSNWISQCASFRIFSRFLCDCQKRFAMCQTIKLQSKSKNICNAHANITEVKMCIAELRENEKNPHFLCGLRKLIK